MRSTIIPAQVLSSVRWFERAIEDDYFVWIISGERFFVRVVPLLFGICVYIASRHTQTEASVAAIWPANGLLLAALLLCGNLRIRLLTLATCFAANALVNVVLGQMPLAAVSFAIINAAEAAIAYVALCRFKADELDFGVMSLLVKFITVCAAAAVLPALVGGFTVVLAHDADFWAASSTWYVADVLGLLVITPAFALAFRPGRSDRRNVPGKQAVALFAVLIAVSCIVFGQNSVPLLFMMSPVCVAIGFRLGPRYAAFATLFLAVVSIYATYQGYGPAAVNSAGTVSSRIWLVQVFCLVNLFTTLFVASAVAELEAMRRRVELLSEQGHDSRRHLDAALDVMNQGLCIFDRDSCVVARNNRFLDIYGLDVGMVPVGTHFNDLMKLCASLSTTSACCMPLLADCDADQTLSDGRTVRISQRRTDGGGVICTYSDITADRKAEANLRHSALHDPLTGLANRRHFGDRVGSLHAAGAPDFSVMLIDVDHFKHINDTHGHSGGDELLQIVARRLEACVRHSDMVARIGGDEFAVLIGTAEGIHTVEAVALRMVDSMAQPVVIEGAVEVVTLSIGIATAAGDIDTYELMKRADEALYVVKQRGRNGVAIFGGVEPTIGTPGIESAPPRAA